MRRNPERMRYKTDSLSSSLCLIAILCDVVYFVMIYASPTIIPGYHTGIDVIINIVFMLVVFWAGEQIKVYDRKWAYGVMALALVQAVRILWLPELYNGLGQLVGAQYAIVKLSLAASAVFLLAAGIISAGNSAALKKYLKTQ